MHLDPTYVVTIRFGFALLFGSAALHKVINWSAFKVTLGKYFMGSVSVSTSLVNMIAVVVITAEAFIVGMCIWPLHGAMTAGIIIVLLLTYGSGMLINLVRGNILLDCGCTWGGARRPVSYALVVRNIGLALLAFPLALPVVSRELGAMDILSICATVLTAGFLYLTSDLLLTQVELTNHEVK